MIKFNSSVFALLTVCVVVISSVCLCDAGAVQSEGPLKCHVCDPSTCNNFNKNAEPIECNVEYLKNNGPSKLGDLSYIEFQQMHKEYPLFSCQKIEAYHTLDRGMHIIRKCQLRLRGNESCDEFYRNWKNDGEKTYTNATCFLCDRDGCNSSGLIYMWAPLLLISIILCFLLK